MPSSPSDLPPALAPHPWGSSGDFLGREPEPTPWDDAAVAILPVPYEATTSWGTGTRDGPAAILEASRYVERYDEQLDLEPDAVGVCTLPPIALTRAGPREAVAELEALYGDLLEVAGDRLIIGLGGEHSITSAPVAAWAERLGPELSVLQLDAHADLRDRYHGTPWNHACVMRRVLEKTERIVAVGVRALTLEERDLIRERSIRTIFAHEMRSPGWVERAVEGLGPNVYVTCDVDFFDPSVVPATGAPEPGGAGWWEAVDLLSAVFRERRVVGADVVELAPRANDAASAFTAAKLVYKMIGLWAASR